MKWIALLLIVSLASCKDNLCSSSVKVSLTNKGTMPVRLMMSNGIDSVVIDANNNSTVSKPLCFRESLKNDGSYKIRFTNASKDTTFAFGYYTNGHPLDEEWLVTWANDSLQLKSIKKRLFYD